MNKYFVYIEDGPTWPESSTLEDLTVLKSKLDELKRPRSSFLVTAYTVLNNPEVEARVPLAKGQEEGQEG